MLDARAQTVAWPITFFFASAAAGSAYLTVNESFPLKVRALAITLFYALGAALKLVMAAERRSLEEVATAAVGRATA
ncbi:MAG: hypothetical protein LC114_09685 [Bryobacterales bacterium]|nr:hypothetical protein [Bryobacterales bacterium]